jgi:hypothetical protein
MLQKSGNKPLTLSGNVYSEVEKESNPRGTDALEGGTVLHCTVYFAALLTGCRYNLARTRLLFRYISRSDVTPDQPSRLP